MLRSVFAAAVLAHAASAFSAPSPGVGANGRDVASLLRGSDRPRSASSSPLAPMMSAAAPSTTTPKLVYFDARGVVEPIRLLLAAAGAEYEDVRYKVDMTAKPPVAAEFQAAKESGALAVNMGRAPILEVDGVQIGQSHAIARFLARKHDMVGDSEIEAAQVDTIYEHVRDIKDNWVKIRMANAKESDEDVKKANIDKFLSEDLPQWCSKLEGALKVCAGVEGCAVGKRMSLADVVIYAWLSCYFPAEHTEAVKAAYDACPTIAAIVTSTGANEGIKAWEAERPVTFM